MNSEKSPLCVFLNGLPGAGKSTYARRTIAGEAGWLNLDIDQIRELLGITAVDFREAGEEVRPLALALLRTQLAAGRNVVIPQLFIEPEEAVDFVAAAEQCRADVIHLLLEQPVETCWRRVITRGQAQPGSAAAAIADLLANEGGPLAITRISERMKAWGDELRPISGRAPLAEWRRIGDAA